MQDPFILEAGASGKEFYERGDFFRLLDSAAPVSVKFYMLGREVAEAVSVTKGYAERFRSEGFDRIRITTADTQEIQFVTRFGSDVFFDAPPVGDTNIVNALETMVQSVATVTNASAELLPANAARKLLMIQNKSAAGTIFLTLDGSPATVANGLRLGPGDVLSLENFTPTGQVFAIGDIASNAEVLTIQGQS